LSPDGTRIVSSDGQDLFLRALDGTQQVNLTAHLDPAATGPAFSPDGTTLAFSAGGTLYQGGPAGDTPRPLAVQGHDPAYSPDGRGLAYTTRATGPDGRITASDSELWLLDLDRGAPRTLLRDLNPQMPAFSPDGHFLVFVGGEGGWSAPGLWVIPATGGETRRLGDAEGFSPVWSDARIWFLAQQGDATVLLCLPMAGGDPSPSGPVTEVARVPGSDGGSLAMAAQGGGLVLATIRSGEAAPTTDLWWVEVGR
jgi:dipeptidyl aminopeptidase/acylaminoacyl peptidase